MSILLKWLLCLCLFIPTVVHAQSIGIIVEEADGSPSAYAYKLIVPSTSLSITSSVATLSGWMLSSNAGIYAGNYLILPADPGAHTLFGFDNTSNTYKNILIGAGLAFDQPTATLSSTGSDTIGWAYTSLSAAPGVPVAGKVYWADNEAAGWDPVNYAGTDDYAVLYTGAAYVGIVDINGNMMVESLTLGGVVLGDATPDAAGEIGFDGTDKYLFYGANAEDLYLRVGSTGNNAIVGTNTGVTDLSFSAINLATTGTVQAGIKINTDANGMSQAEMTAVGMYGTMFFASGAGTWLLPDALTGMSFCVYSTTADAIVLNPDDSDDITLNGTLLDNGDSITSASAAGDFICLVAQSDTHWFTLGRSGTWTDTN